MGEGMRGQVRNRKTYADVVYQLDADGMSAWCGALSLCRRPSSWREEGLRSYDILTLVLESGVVLMASK